VLLPDEERALGAEYVLLPPDLTQILARDAAERLVGRLDLGELDAPAGAQDEAVRRRQVPAIALGVEEEVGGLDPMGGGHPRRDLRLA